MKLVHIEKRQVRNLNAKKYDIKYMSFKFINIDDGEKRPQCLYCMKTLAVDSMKPNKLKRHAETVHAECVGKTPEFSHRKVIKFNKKKQALSRTIVTSSP